MRESFQRVGPARLQVRQGGGCLSVFGLPFFAGGIFTLLGSLRLIPIQNADEVRFGIPMLSMMGIIFTLVGAVLVFGRSWTTVDALQRTVLKQWGLLVPMRSKSHRLDEYSLVRLDFKRGDSDSADQFPVTLTARTGPALALFSSTKYGESRERAVAVAQLLQFDIEDATTNHGVRVTSAQADMPLQERWRLAKRDDEAAAQPRALRSEITHQGAETRIAVPVRRYHPLFFLVFLVPMAIAASFVAPFDDFFRTTNTPPPFAWLFLGFFVFGFVILPAWSALTTFLRSRRGRTIITVSTWGIRLDERRIWRTRTVASIPASDVIDIDYSARDFVLASTREEMEAQQVGRATERVIAAVSALVGGRGVTIKTRKGLHTFGEGLDDDEVRYVCHVAKKALVGEP